MNTPKLSIIVPVYNVENYLGECIESILRQTFRNYELILVDDGSTDRSGEICDEYAAKDDRIAVVHKENGGLSDARNAGIKVCKGEYVTFVDSDDFIDRDTYELNMDIVLTNSSIDILQYPYVRYDGKNDYTAECKLTKDIKGHEDIFKNLWSGSPISYSVWNKIYKRAIVEETSFAKGRYFEDCMFVYDIYKNVQNYYLSDIGLYYYRIRNNAITSGWTFNKNYDQYIAHLNIYKEMFNYPSLAKFKGIAFERLFRRLIQAQKCDKKKNLNDDYKLLDSISPSIKEIALSPKHRRMWLILAIILGTKRLTKLYICYINKIKRTHC